MQAVIFLPPKERVPEKIRSGGGAIVEGGLHITEEKKLPVNEKYSLSIKEAADYFSIGTKKIRRLVKDNIQEAIDTIDAK